MDDLASLSARIRRLEDHAAISNLKARYAQLCDAKYHHGALRPESELEVVARRIADLFTEDAVWDGGTRFGTSIGQVQIYERFRKATFKYAIHFFMQPEILIEGDNATCRWYLLEAATLLNSSAVWIAGTEDDHYQRVDEAWRISRMTVNLEFIAPVEQGWERVNLMG
ncbi:MAG: nuclear transport factor 2 family protein [Gammaproteobacteria bacterium]|nr:nuclear transport factor 2 family protein [Gammaproteobacteria bacterium]